VIVQAFQIWFPPAAIILFTIVVAIPMSAYMARIMDGHYRPPRLLRWAEQKLDTGQMNWKQYTIALLCFQTVLFIYSFIVMALQPVAPWNPRHLGMLSPSTIFSSVISFMTNTDVQHYSGDQVLSNFTQFFWAIPNLFVSAAIGLCALALIIRLFRGEKQVGNYFLDMWRVVVYIFLPVAFILSVIFMQQGMPMTFQSTIDVQTLEAGAMGTTDKGAPKPQTLVVGPVAAFIPQKMLGTNGGGFYGMNSAHPYENPTAGTNFFTTFGMMVFPFSLVLMYGRMLKKVRHAVVIFTVMLLLFIATIVWMIVFDTLRPNPGLTAHPHGVTYQVPSRTAPGGRQPVPVPAVAGLPVDQHLGNLEGKDLRFGTSAGATFGAITTDVTCGAINAEQDSMNPIAAVSPMAGMWLNAIFGGKGVGMINMLLFLIIGVFIAGQMVGRTPEYLGRKIGGTEMKLAVIALLVHPLMILFPAGLFAATPWGLQAVSNPGPHGLSQIVYQFSSASANNGSAFDGLGVTFGLNSNASPAPMAVPWDVAAGLVMLFSRLLPILAPIAMAASLGAKKVAPFGLGTLRDDTPTFGGLLVGSMVIIGALLFLIAAALGPIADQLGPIPFGG
jgi:potassium-transporting ATPase potassium-binding subunit